ncbi:MAG: CBS domain-containing protein [Caldimicrobium sp.]|nr:CBS domain-containing protein [Caldimicrobium sp.]MCX7874414.1 CBS domain-containing protein [Caldimicrobium sp.]MDW8094001.1 transporter associated domain-containing protein [Caldimicrobium sp.]
MGKEKISDLIRNFFLKKFPKNTSLRNTEEKEELLFLLQNFKELELRDFLIPRINLKALDLNSTWEEVKEYIINYTHYYYPVYKNTLDNYVGYIRLRDLVPGLDKTLYNWHDFLFPALTLPETLPILSAVEKFRKENVKLAFIVDEHSEFIGIVRFKDIVEDLFLEIGMCYKPDSQGWITIPASTKLRRIERCYKIKLPEGNYETLSGLILDVLKRIPSKGETLSIPPLQIEILEANERKIDKVKIKILP